MGKAYMEGRGMMSCKQYTFKTTEDTEWLEEILDAATPQNRSKLIRECIILGLLYKGITRKDTQKTEVTHVSDVTQDTQKTDSIQTTVLSPPSMEEIDEPIDMNFEEKLNNLGGMYNE